VATSISIINSLQLQRRRRRRLEPKIGRCFERAIVCACVPVCVCSATAARHSPPLMRRSRPLLLAAAAAAAAAATFSRRVVAALPKLCLDKILLHRVLRLS